MFEISGDRFNAFVVIDRIIDYVPIVSSISNLVYLFIQSRQDSENNQIEHKSRLYTYINKKDPARCKLLTIPIFGNLIVAFRDYKKRNEEMASVPNKEKLSSVPVLDTEKQEGETGHASMIMDQKGNIKPSEGEAPEAQPAAPKSLSEKEVMPLKVNKDQSQAGSVKSSKRSWWGVALAVAGLVAIAGIGFINTPKVPILQRLSCPEDIPYKGFSVEENYVNFYAPRLNQTKEYYKGLQYSQVQCQKYGGIFSSEDTEKVREFSCQVFTRSWNNPVERYPKSDVRSTNVDYTPEAIKINGEPYVYHGGQYEWEVALLPGYRGCLSDGVNEIATMELRVAQEKEGFVKSTSVQCKESPGDREQYYQYLYSSAKKGSVDLPIPKNEEEVNAGSTDVFCSGSFSVPLSPSSYYGQIHTKNYKENYYDRLRYSERQCKKYGGKFEQVDTEQNEEFSCRISAWSSQSSAIPLLDMPPPVVANLDIEPYLYTAGQRTWNKEIKPLINRCQAEGGTSDVTLHLTKKGVLSRNSMCINRATGSIRIE